MANTAKHKSYFWAGRKPVGCDCESDSCVRWIRPGDRFYRCVGCGCDVCAGCMSEGDDDICCRADDYELAPRASR